MASIMTSIKQKQIWTCYLFCETETVGFRSVSKLFVWSLNTLWIIFCRSSGTGKDANLRVIVFGESFVGQVSGLPAVFLQNIAI